MLEDFAKLIAWIIPVIVLAAIFLPQTIRILREYERGVIFRLGKLLGTVGGRLKTGQWWWIQNQPLNWLVTGLELCWQEAFWCWDGNSAGMVCG
jgi:regulator of protease activity HflC (stomatin/prohibitin superfamily)